MPRKPGCPQHPDWSVGRVFDRQISLIRGGTPPTGRRAVNMFRNFQSPKISFSFIFLLTPLLFIDYNSRVSVAYPSSAEAGRMDGAQYRYLHFAGSSATGGSHLGNPGQPTVNQNGLLAAWRTGKVGGH